MNSLDVGKLCTPKLFHKIESPISYDFHKIPLGTFLVFRLIYDGKRELEINW